MTDNSVTETARRDDPAGQRRLLGDGMPVDRLPLPEPGRSHAFGWGAVRLAVDPPLLAVAVVLAATALLLGAFAAGPGVLPWDVAVAAAVQDPDGPWLVRLAGVLNWLGQGWPTMTALTLAGVALMVARRAWRLALLVGLAGASRLLVPVIKGAVASDRPGADLARVAEVADGYGYPSGHAYGATALFGALAVAASALVPRRAAAVVVVVRLVAVALVLLTALARIRVGAHWPSDVLGGLLWGGAVLALFVAIVGPNGRG